MYTLHYLEYGKHGKDILITCYDLNNRLSMK